MVKNNRAHFKEYRARKGNYILCDNAAEMSPKRTKN